jgi:hypothetical protein
MTSQTHNILLSANKAALVAAVILFALSASAATTHYVDSAATGANNGSSWANAWTTLGAITGLSAGDTVEISTGTYTVSNWQPAGGTAGNVITYRVGQTNGHNGTVTFNCSGGQWVTCPSYITLSGDAGDGAMHFVLTACNRPVVAIGTTSVTINYVNMGRIAVDNSDLGCVAATGASKFNLGWFYCYVDSTTADNCIHALNMGGSTWGDNSIHNGTIYVPHMDPFVGGNGADAIQFTGTGIDIYSNTIVGYEGYSGNQHQDGCQGTGCNYFIRIHDNMFLDISNYPIYDSMYYCPTRDMLIYNNIMCYSDSRISDSHPDINGYTAGANPKGLEIGAGDTYAGNGYGNGPPIDTRVTIFNNLVVDFRWRDAFGLYNASPVTIPDYQAVGCIFANNVSVNSGGTTLDAAVQVYDDNGGTTFITSGQASNVFKRYVAFDGTNNDYHLNASAVTMIGKGFDASAWFTKDKEGNARTVPWNVGPLGFGGTVTNPVINITPSSYSFGSVLTNLSVTNTFTVRNIGGGTVSGAASVAAPFYTVGTASYSLGSNVSTTVSVRFSPTTPGYYSQAATFTGADGATVALSGQGAGVSGLSFAANSGTVGAPLAVSGAWVTNAALTLFPTEGAAVYNFTVTTATNYVCLMDVIAPSEAANSLYVVVDGLISDPLTIWDIPVTTGCERRAVSWRGNGSDSTNQYTPMLFGLVSGTHTLTVGGREGGVGFSNVVFTPYVDATGTPPTLIAPPASLRLRNGQTASFSVQAAGDAPLAYQWTRHNTNLPGATTSSLYLGKVWPQDNGDYVRVVVTNAAGGFSTGRAYIFVDTLLASGMMGSGLIFK